MRKKGRTAPFSRHSVDLWNFVRAEIMKKAKYVRMYSLETLDMEDYDWCRYTDSLTYLRTDCRERRHLATSD